MKCKAFMIRFLGGKWSNHCPIGTSANSEAQYVETVENGALHIRWVQGEFVPSKPRN